MKVAELSIFFPFWNEEKNIRTVVKRAIPVADRVAEKWEIIMVDDGSSDNTAKIAKSLEEQNKNLRLIQNKTNRGYGAALKAGFRNARYDLIVFNDGDNQFEFEEVTRFLEKIPSSDIVIGFRKKRIDHPLRHMLMNLLKIWDLIFFGIYFRDIDCGFKLFKRSALLKIGPLKSEGAMITTEILAKAKRTRLSIKQVEVTHKARIFGDQSGGNPRVILRALKESFIILKEVNRGRN